MLIGLAGKKQSGKTTVSHYLQEKLNGDYITYALADPLKAFVNSLFKWSTAHSDGFLKEVYTNVLIPTRSEVGASISHFLNGKYYTRNNVNDFFKVLDQFSTKDPLLYTISPRQAYQIIGTEWGRTIDSKLWVSLADSFCSDNTNVIISDVRFEDEAEFVRDRGILVHIERTTLDDNHISEKGVRFDSYDYLIYNNGNLFQLADAVEKFADMINMWWVADE